MLQEHARTVECGIIVVDLCLALFSMVVANGLIGRYTLHELFREFGIFLVAAAGIWFLLLRFAGFYRSLRVRSYAALAKNILQTTFLAGVINAALLFMMAPHFSRKVYVLHLILAFVGMLGWKLANRAAQKAVRRRGYNFRKLLVVGTQSATSRFIEHVEAHRDWGFQIIGCVQVMKGPEKEECAGYPVLGRLDQLLTICKTRPVDEVIFTLPADYLKRIDELLPRLEAMGITFRLALDYYKPQKSRMLVGALGDQDPVPVVTYYRVTLDPTQLFLKRLLDIVGGLTGIALTAILLPFIWTALKLDSSGPLLFKQKRVGKNGRSFTCYKFRSMYSDAEARKQELMDQNEMHGAIFKMENDPRVTRVGKFLRKTSLDELPQFWNVLKGEMSLVGTRPPTPDEVDQYEEWHRGRIAMKPGLTGLWQTSGRNRIDDFDKICRLDMFYIDNWSMWLDLKLLAKTLAVVALGVGAR